MTIKGVFIYHIKYYAVNYVRRSKGGNVMPVTIAQQRVRDYSTWKIAYNEMKDLRFLNGALSDQVYRDEADPNIVTVIIKWNSLTNAKKYYNSPEMKAAMARGGVEGLFNIAYVNEG
jgi:heme-degrading monooxygenase HmoA